MQNLKNLPLDELRQMWADAWDKRPSDRLGRSLLETSLIFKLSNATAHELHSRLDQLIKTYKRNPKCFDERCSALKPGTQIMRRWKGKNYTVLVKDSGFIYGRQFYTSLSQIANDITGTRWNGHLFFGLKKKDGA